MAIYDADLQAAVDATSIARAGGETDLETRFRHELKQREIETSDEEWLTKTVAGIRDDPNYMVEGEPSDYSSDRPHE